MLFISHHYHCQYNFELFWKKFDANLEILVQNNILSNEVLVNFNANLKTGVVMLPILKEAQLKILYPIRANTHFE